MRPALLTRRAFALGAPLLLGAGGAQAAAPRRAVVYDLGALDIFHALGLPVAGVPRAQLPAYLAGYAARAEPAGSLFEPDYDALSRLRPDLVIVGGRSAARRDTLAKIAPTLDMGVRPQHLVEDVSRNIDAIARLYGRQAQGRALVRRVEAEAAALRRQAARAAPGLLLLQINQTLVPQAPGGRFGFLFDALGARSAIAAQDVPPRGTPYTFDDMARLDPAWIYVIDRNTATGQAAGGGAIVPAQQVFDHPQVKATRAGRKGQLVFLDPKGWYLMGSSGPTALLNNIAQLRQAYTAAGL